jgi:hypothetical protein
MIEYNISLFYNANKNTIYRNSIIKQATSLLSFLKKEGFIDNDGNLDMSFVVRQSNLTPEGAELFKKAVPAWLRRLDRRLDSSSDKYNVKYLEDELEKIRAPAQPG